MYTVVDNIFLNEFNSLQKEEKRIVANVMRKITNDFGLSKGDYDNHLLTKGKFKGCFDCHPLVKQGNKNLVLIYKIKANKLHFIRLNTHQILGLV
jgi:mRNA-degrading endonuclease YafQ of YafQ-DinJ toxin-antitoxin module